MYSWPSGSQGHVLKGQVRGRGKTWPLCPCHLQAFAPGFLRALAPGFATRAEKTEDYVPGSGKNPSREKVFSGTGGLIKGRLFLLGGPKVQTLHLSFSCVCQTSTMALWVGLQQLSYKKSLSRPIGDNMSPGFCLPGLLGSECPNCAQRLAQ